MFHLKSKDVKEFSTIYEQTKLIRSTTDIFYHNIRMLHYMKTKFVTQEIYDDLYDGILADIELVSSPIDTVIPNTTEYPVVDGVPQIPDDYCVCTLNNYSIPEYSKIVTRVTIDDIKATVDSSHPLNMAIIENPKNIDKIREEVFKFWLIRRYFVQIEMLHLQQMSQMTPIIEYVVKNITLDNIKSHLVSRKIKGEKAYKLLSETAFTPNLSRIKSFYNEEAEGIIPQFDPFDLLMRLASNLTLNSDIYIISGIYHTISFAMNDFAQHEEYRKNNVEYELSECERYVMDVLSKL